MIGSIRGKILRIGNGTVLVDCHGVGYEVKLRITNPPAGRAGYELRIGEEIQLFTYMSVSENDVSLFGFKTFEDVDFFKLLITVSGVGPKTGAMILGQSGAEKVRGAIANADVKFFENIKGVGKKTAQRIIVDLKSKIGGLKELDLNEVEGGNDLVESLKQFGFDRKEIEKVVSKLPAEMEKLEDQIGWCLQNLG